MAIERPARFMSIMALAAALACAPACLSIPAPQVSTTGGPIGGGSTGGGNGGSNGGGNGGGTTGTSSSAGSETGGSPQLHLGGQSGPTTATAVYPNPCEIDVDFGDVPIGQVEHVAIQIENRGSGPLNLSQVNPILDPEFALAYGPQQPLYAGDFGEFMVTFQPYKVGEVTSTFTIQTSGVNLDCPGPAAGAGNVLTIDLAGNGIALSLVVEPNPLDFGKTAINTTSQMSFTLQNTGVMPVTGITATIGGSDANLFPIPISPSTLAAADSATVEVEYSPLALEMRSEATVTFSGSGGQTVALTLYGEPVQ